MLLIYGIYLFTDGGLAQRIWQKSLSKKCFWQLMLYIILRGLVEKTLMTDSLFAGKKRISKDKMYKEKERKEVKEEELDELESTALLLFGSN